jgi:predicted metal-dependent peptidase
MSIEDKIFSSLLEINDNHPEYEPVISRVALIEDNVKETAWMNARCQMGYNPSFFKNLSDKEIYAVVLHEIHHYVDAHFQRATQMARVYGHIHHIQFNIAADMEINQELDNLPGNCVYPETYNFPRGKTMEEYYTLLEDFKKIYMIGSVNGDFDRDGHTLPGEIEVPSEGLTEEEQAIADQISEELKDQSKARGFGAGKHEEYIKLKKKNAINIHQYIRVTFGRIVSDPKYGFDEIDYNMFGKTTIPRMLKFKTFDRNPKMQIAVILDTSGSRNKNDIIISLSRLMATLSSLDAESCFMDIFEVDGIVQRVTRAYTTRDIPKKFTGRGGTELTKAYAEFKIRYDLVLVMTDGYLPWSEFDDIPAYYRKRTIVGVDKHNLEDTIKNCQFPVFKI